MDLRQIENCSDCAHEVIVRHNLIETKRIEKLLLVSVVPPHHRPPPTLITSSPVNHGSSLTSTTSATKSAMADIARKILCDAGGA
jgi:hypothetical protein